MTEPPLNQDLPPELLQPLRAMQVVVLALVSGMLVFGGVMVFLSARVTPNPGLWLLVYLCIGAVGFVVVLRRVVLRVMLKTERGKIARLYPAAGAGTAQAENAALAQLFIRSTIAGTALLEGSVMFNAITFLLTRHPLTLVLAVVVLAGMAMQFPTRARFEEWLETQRGLLAEQRSA